MTEQVPSKMTDAEWVELVSAMGGPKTEQRPSKEVCDHLYQAHLRELFGRCLTCEIERLQLENASLRDDKSDLQQLLQQARAAHEPPRDVSYAQEIINELSEARRYPELRTWQLVQKALDWICLRTGLAPVGAAQPPPAEQAQWKWKCERCKSLVSILAGGCESCGAPRPVPASAPGAG